MRNRKNITAALETYFVVAVICVGGFIVGTVLKVSSLFHRVRPVARYGHE